MDTAEEMSREVYESQRDAAAPRCCKCRKSENQVAMVACAMPTCHAFLCEECATEIEWELEGCCDEHASALASFATYGRALDLRFWQALYGAPPGSRFWPGDGGRLAKAPQITPMPTPGVRRSALAVYPEELFPGCAPVVLGSGLRTAGQSADLCRSREHPIHKHTQKRYVALQRQRDTLSQ
jgi:hypothetical protein